VWGHPPKPRMPSHCESQTPGRRGLKVRGFRVKAFEGRGCRVSGIQGGYRGTSSIRKCPAPWDPQRTLLRLGS